MSLTNLKKLEKLRIDGLVWHRGYHRWAYAYGWMYQIPDEGDEEDPNDYDSWSDKGHSRVPDTWNEKAWDGDDAESVCSTDSKFGVDIRFANSIDEELRVERLRGWITKYLLAEAKRVGSVCRDVVIRKLVTDGKGLTPQTMEFFD
jgi:hypothetical protein